MINLFSYFNKNLYYHYNNSVRQTPKMSRTSLRSAITLTKDKPSDHRTLESSTLRTSATPKNSSTFTSNPTSSASSVANISINFMKDSSFPKLFTCSPMLFSFNGSNGGGGQPLSTTNSSTSMRNSLGWMGSGFSSGTRTPSCSSYSSLNHLFEKDHYRKGSLFSKKSSQLTIDLKKKLQEREKSTTAITRPYTNSVTKQIKPHVSNVPECMSSNVSYDSVGKQENIKVFVRIKPSENKDLCIKPYIMRLDQRHVEMDGKIMTYDHVFAVNSQQEEIFEKIAKPVLSGVFEGYNGTIFAYGQTGSGKTHTIFGGSTAGSEGIISRSLQYIFENVKKDHKISLSLLEIYKQQLIDLLTQAKNDLKIKETFSGISVQNLSRISMKNISDTLSLIENSLKNRRVASTKLNQKSSRSHTILTIYLESMELESKLCLIDLAGSQKANKAGVVGQNFQQMKKINYSLSCLGNVINALVTRKKSDHIPFRDSKLTRLLKDSLSGKFRTSIIVNCSSDQGTEDETMSSLKFADRAKKVKITISKCQGKGKENVEYLHKVIQQLTVDLENTKRELNKYKQNCIEKAEQQKQKQPEAQAQTELKLETSYKSKIHQSPQVTARQTIPSERAHLDQQMKKYGKENRLINVVSLCQQKNKPKSSINFSSELSSLNVSKSTVHRFQQISSPSVSSLSYRNDEGIDDLSFNFSGFHKQEQGQEKNMG